MLINDLRKPRIAGIALFDLILAIVGTALIFEYFGYTKTQGALFAIPIGIVTHYILGIDTTLNYYLGISDKPTA